jgi:hypothetical protein
MELIDLPPHPAAPAGPVRVRACAARAGGAVLHAGYALEGALARVRLPGAGPAGFRDGLWRHTCFELFLKADGSSYLEYNLSPQGAFAVYRFADYRVGRLALADAGPTSVALTRSAQALRFEAELPLPEEFAVLTLRAALAVVVEDEAGTLSYHALAHPAPAPDFHAAGAFRLAIGSPGAR